MKLVAIVSFYDEDPERLRACINHVADLGATDVIMVDGAYALYPNGSPSSGWFYMYAYHQAIYRRMGGLLYTPQTTWKGNEVEKRTTAFELGLTITDPNDYFLIWDADWYLDSGEQDIKPFLKKHMPRYADMEITDDPVSDSGWWWMRIVLRAMPGMHYWENHYTIRYLDGDVVHTHPHLFEEELERGYQLPVRIRHKPRERSSERLENQRVYYKQRDELGIERA